MVLFYLLSMISRSLGAAPTSAATGAWVAGNNIDRGATIKSHISILAMNLGVCVFYSPALFDRAKLLLLLPTEEKTCG